MRKTEGNPGATRRLNMLALAAGLCLGSGAMAQSAEGSLNGRAKAEASVQIVNLDNGQQRTIKADKSGSFSFSKLAPGRYKVSSEGVTREAMVSIGTGTTVALDTEELDRIEIRGTRSRVIDVTSTESNSVFTAEQIRSLPVARDI